jgi:hypothetical protein
MKTTMMTMRRMRQMRMYLVEPHARINAINNSRSLSKKGKRLQVSKNYAKSHVAKDAPFARTKRQYYATVGNTKASPGFLRGGKRHTK